MAWPPSAPASVSASCSPRTSRRPRASPSRPASPARTCSWASPFPRRWHCSAWFSRSCSRAPQPADAPSRPPTLTGGRKMFFAEGEHSPVVPTWQEVIIGTIAFGVLCFVLMKYVFPVMEKTFKARVDAIEGGIQRAERAQAEANALLEQYKAQLAEAR